MKHKNTIITDYVVFRFFFFTFLPLFFKIKTEFWQLIFQRFDSIENHGHLKLSKLGCQKIRLSRPVDCSAVQHLTAPMTASLNEPSTFSSSTLV